MSDRPRVRITRVERLSCDATGSTFMLQVGPATGDLAAPLSVDEVLPYAHKRELLEWLES